MDRWVNLMRIDVFTLFPDLVHVYLQAGVLGKALEANRLTVQVTDIRDFASDRHRTTDDQPYGGGGGMVMKPEPIFAAVEDRLGDSLPRVPILLMTPQGERFDQQIARELSQEPRLALISGRYEGVDERVRQHLVTRELSIGDYVLSGGELPALVVVDAVARLLPGVLGDEEAAAKDSHSTGLLEGPHYTRPAAYRGWEVPEVLRSGDHARIARWRLKRSLLRTLERRPDLIRKAVLSKAGQEILNEILQEKEQGDVQGS